MARRASRGVRAFAALIPVGGAVLAGVGTSSGALAQTANDTASGAARAGPSAAAWALRLAESDGSQQVGLAEVSAESAPTPGARGTPVVLDGQQPVAAAASSSAPDVADNALSWQDPTGSISVQGGFAQASVTPSSASSRAGIGTGSGSSFSLANKMLSWDQQQQLTGEVANLNAAIMPRLNALLGGLGPQLALLGLSVPVLQQMSPLALIDVADGEAVTVSATTASSPSYASAKAQAQFGTLSLFGGFITLSGVQATADSEGTAGVPTQSASATFGQLQLAGIAVTADHNGVKVAGNSAVDRQILQPLLDLLLTELSSSGVRLHFGETSLTEGVQEATALELDVSTSVGLMQLSVGHAEAVAGPTAGPVEPPSGTSPSGPPATPPLPTAARSAPVAAASSPAAPASLGPTPSSKPSRGGGGIPTWLGVAPPAAVARALHGTFLWLLFGALGAAVLPPLVIGYRRHRGGSAIVPIGEERSP
jgi:hypothetical protein